MRYVKKDYTTQLIDELRQLPAITSSHEQAKKTAQHKARQTASGAICNICYAFAPRIPFAVEQVIPALQRRGLFRTEYSGTTLREHLGL